MIIHYINLAACAFAAVACIIVAVHALVVRKERGWFVASLLFACVFIAASIVQVIERL